eukprot:1947336-Alexandrium_andersonii.AAC.1
MAWMAAVSGTLSGCLASGRTGVLSAALRPSSSRRPTKSSSNASPSASAFWCSSSATVRK